MKNTPGKANSYASILNSSVVFSKSDTIYAFALIILAIFYTVSYLANPYLPGNSAAHPRGWWDWFDQGQYLASALALAKGDLTGPLHHYPLGYAALAAPFTRWTNIHPFYLINMLAFIGACHVFAKICGVFSINKLFSIALFIFAVFADSVIFQQFTTPWSTTPVVFYVYILIYLAIREKSPDLLSVVGAAAVAALLIVTRPSDLLVVLPAGIALALRLFTGGDSKKALLCLAAGLAAGMVVLGLYLMVHVAIFGFARSPYMIASQVVGFDGRFFLEKLYAVLLNPLPVYGEGQGILQRSRWMLFAAPGLVVGLVHGWRWAVIAAAVTINIGYYTAYVDFLPHGIWRYFNIHYMKLAYPLMALAGVMLIRECWRQPLRVLIPSALAILLVLCVRFETVEKGPSSVVVTSPHNLTVSCESCDDARVVVLRPARLSYADIYFATNSAVLHGVTYRNIYDFRTIPVADTIRIVLPTRIAGGPLELAFRAPHQYAQESPPSAATLSGRFVWRRPRLP